MKTINLKSVSKHLSNKEMKLVTGGEPEVNWMDGVLADGGGGTGTCCAHSSSGSLFCWISKSEAQFMAVGGHWCCDSCATATWTANCYN